LAAPSRDIHKHRLLTELLDQVIEQPACIGIVTTIAKEYGAHFHAW
jgi:hypothetical protein